MSAPDAAVTGLCFRCGGPVAAAAATCPYCGMPVILAPEAASPPGGRPPTSPIVPAYFEALGSPGPTLTAGPAPRGRLGWRGLVAIGLVALLLVAGGSAALTSRLLRLDAAGTVRTYFAALAAGDGTRALRYVQTPAGFRPADFPLLGSAALADTARRPSEVHIGRAAPISGAPAGLDASAVTATYRVGGQTVAQPMVVLHSGGSYRLQSPFVEVAVQNAAGRKITVNGVALGGQQLDTVGFPESFEAAAAGNELFAAGSAAGTPRAGRQLPVIALDLGAPTFATGALAEIQRQARNELDACAASVQPVPAGCPFGLNVPGTGSQVRWSITTYPAVTAAVAPSVFGDVSVPVTDDRTGKVHWDITYTGLDGKKRHESGDLAFTVAGSAQLTGSGIHVSLAD